MNTAQCKKKSTSKSSESRFEVGDDFADTTLVVEDRKLHVNKTLLMIHSPVFHKMFTNDFREKELSEIPLPGKKYSTMVELLSHIYPGNGAGLIKDDTLEDILQLADEYDVQQVFTNCTQYINNNLSSEDKLSTDRTLFYLYVVERYEKLQSLRSKLIERASQIPANDMARSKFFLLVPGTATRDALLQQILYGVSYR
ncbi:BTB and MATH domain-containing protein 38-like isoform X2 [Pomacea canaliculata]|uniref:BTB and MATH domain-containing protein 38-like isoform X2 n=1 Tax=Pomacea canaliculata TaxID=400727 RepID=UPI000D731E96|nr:BTB and MATH domain-containing protein 38-like isoform X2 [Pomacea canaliculata]